MTNREVCKVLKEIGELLELKGENPFKSRAYFQAIETIETLEAPLEELVKEGRLSSLKGFGKALTKKVTELIETGRLEYYEQLKQSIPPALYEISVLPGLDRKKAGLLYLKLGITSPEELRQACRDKRVAPLRGFNRDLEQKLLLELETNNA